MPTSPIQPGIFSEGTDRTAQGRWKEGNNVRFRNGLPEKIGGYRDINSGVTYLGVCRKMTDWQTLAYYPWVGMGTSVKLYLTDGSTFTDITPVRLTTSAGDPRFAAVNGSATITVTETNHGAAVNDYVTFSASASLGGTITAAVLDQEYQILTVADANTFTFTATATANASDTGDGGAGTIATYKIASGTATSVNGLGYGAGTYGGAQAYGAAATTSSILLRATTWSLDTWGEDLIANKRGAAIYVKDISAGAASPATIISNAPATAEFILVSPTERYVIAYGAHDGSAPDPMLVAWCDQEDYTAWTPTSTNTAGSQRLDYGTEIVCAVKARGETLIFTDLGVYSQRYVGPRNIYSFTQIGTGAQVASPNSVVESDGFVMWMGRDDFYTYDGTVRRLPCEVRGHVFDNINEQQFVKVASGRNERFQEVIWFYTSAGASENDLWVSTNLVDGSWATGQFGRTAWIDKGELFDTPCAADENGILYTHEDGVDANGAALVYSLESYDVDTTDGAAFMHVDKLIADYASIAGNHTLSLLTRQYPMSSQETKGPYTVTSATKKLSVRARGRQIAFKMEGTEIGTSFRMGPWNAQGPLHGRK
jgi:hypothetical protein